MAPFKRRKALLMTTEQREFLWEMLWQIPGKAEIVDGRIVLQAPDGALPALAKSQILFSLHQHAREIGKGRAIGGLVAFRVDLPHRQSFCPDAAYINQERDGNMGAIEGAPVFATEVRSENDYGPRMNALIQTKIEDYFAAGTLAVWDVDLLSENVVTLHTPNNAPRVFRRGEIADAGAALPAWSIPVDEIFA